MSIVEFVCDEETNPEVFKQFVFQAWDVSHFVYLGEIPNQPDHGMFIVLNGNCDDQGPIIGPYDVLYFKELDQ